MSSSSTDPSSPPRKPVSQAPDSGASSRLFPEFFEQSSAANGTSSRLAFRSPQSVSRRQLLDGAELSELNESRRRLDFDDGEDGGEPKPQSPIPLAEESADDLRTKVEELRQRRERVDELLGHLRNSMARTLLPPDGLQSLLIFSSLMYQVDLLSRSLIPNLS